MQSETVDGVVEADGQFLGGRQAAKRSSARPTRAAGAGRTPTRRRTGRRAIVAARP